MSQASTLLTGLPKISRTAPAFAHVVPRRRDERSAVRGSWVLYVVCLLFLTGVVVVPPTWKVAFTTVRQPSYQGGAHLPGGFSADIVAPILDGYAFASEWLVAGTEGAGACSLAKRLADRGKTSFAVALRMVGKERCGGVTVQGYTSGVVARRYAKSSPDAVLLLLWESPHYRGSAVKRMMGELAEAARGKDIVVVSPSESGEREKTHALIAAAGCPRGGRGVRGEEGHDQGETSEGRRVEFSGGVVTVDTYTCS